MLVDKIDNIGDFLGLSLDIVSELPASPVLGQLVFLDNGNAGAYLYNGSSWDRYSQAPALSSYPGPSVYSLESSPGPTISDASSYNRTLDDQLVQHYSSTAIDGSTSAQQFVPNYPRILTTDVSGLDFGTGDFEIEVRIQQSPAEQQATYSKMGIISQRSFNGFNYTAFYLYRHPSGYALVLETRHASGSRILNVQSDYFTSFSTNKWHHLKFRRNGSDLYISIDDELTTIDIGNTNIGFDTGLNAMNAATIGVVHNSSAGSDSHFLGKMAGFTIKV